MNKNKNISDKKTDAFDIDSLLKSRGEDSPALRKNAKERLADILSSVDEDDDWIPDAEKDETQVDFLADSEGDASESEDVLTPEADVQYSNDDLRAESDADDDAAVNEPVIADIDDGSDSDEEAGAGSNGEVDFEVFETASSIEELAQEPPNAGDAVSERLSKLFNANGVYDSPEQKKKTHKDIARDLGGFEEIDMSDTETVNATKARFSRKKRSLLLTLCGTAVFFVLGLIVELFPVIGFTPLRILSPDFPSVFALIDLQLLCFASMCTLDSLAVGVKNIADRRFSPKSTAFCIVVACAIQAIGSAIFWRAGSEIPQRLFCTIGEFALLMLSVYEYLTVSADDKSFRVASSSSHKFGAFETDLDSSECRRFQRHINPETAKAITVKKGVLYSGFVERNERRPRSEKKLGVMTLVVLAVSVLSGVFMAIAKASAYVGITSACVIFVSALPCNLFLVSALPKYLAAKDGKKINAALIGQNASEEYNGLSIVVFNDTEVFLPKDVRISSIKTYNGMELEGAVVAMARIFRTVGGPLSKIFAKMLEGREIPQAGVVIDRITDGSIEVTLDGRKYVLATTSYLTSNGVKLITDSIDSAFEQSHGSLLHMLCDGRVSAKFYIKYAINPSFERTLSGLHDANLNVGIKSNDPCIDTDLIYSYLDKATYSLSVIKGSSAADIPTVMPVVSSGVIALKSVHNFLEMLLRCECTGRCVKVNNVIRIVACVISAIIALLFVFTSFSGIHTLLPLLVQIFWLFPVVGISYLLK